MSEDAHDGHFVEELEDRENTSFFATTLALGEEEDGLVLFD